jgi:hypothetical protein
VEFSSLCHSHKLSCSWLLGACPCSCSLLPGPACFIFDEGFPSPPLRCQGTPPSLLHVFIILIAYYSVSLFSLGGGRSVQGGYADLAQACLWEYRVPLSSPCGLHLPKLSGLRPLAAWGALLVSLFNVKWRCSAQAGGVEGSRLNSCQAGALPLEPLCQSFFCIFFFKIGFLKLFSWAGLESQSS